MEANMLKRLGLSALMLCSAVVFAQPQAAQAADRDDYRRQEYRRDARFDAHRVRHDGYFDRAGCWHGFRR
jgi:hypothetical protein